MTEAPALDVNGLDVAFRVRGRPREVLHGVGFTIGRGEAYGLVGESGCGKSTVALACVGYLPRNGRVTGGRILVDGRDLGTLGGADLRRLRATSVAMVYQDPGKALNPSLKIGRQMREVFEYLRLPGDEADARSLDMLRRVRIADAGQVMHRYPHQLSGGMQQRVCIAMALAIEPALLILDEPTTGLDATIEAEVLDLVRDLRREFATAILFISHNLGVVRQVCDRVGVLYAGRLVEEGTTDEVFRAPRHPYTVGLLRCLPRRGLRKSDGPLDTIPGLPPPPGTRVGGCVFNPRCGLVQDVCRAREPALLTTGPGHVSRCHFHERAGETPIHSTGTAGTARRAAGEARPILAVENVSKTFRLHGHEIAALRDVSLAIMPGQTLGLVGESGSGKTTFAKVLLGLTEPDGDARVELDGQKLAPSLAGRSREAVRDLQIVFQNPDSAINRAHRVRRIIGRAIRKLSGLKGSAAAARLGELTDAVRLAGRYLEARPRQLSGGLKQRVAIARAFAGNPRLVVCDEPTSALDVSVQAAILNLLAELQETEGVSYLFISHDLNVVRYLSDRIAVLYLGRLMEIGPAERVFSGPHHPYTEALLSAVPDMDDERERVALTGPIPSAVNLPGGCVFHTRCPRRIGPICDREEPPLAEIDDGHAVRCHLPVEELGRVRDGPAPRRRAPELSPADPAGTDDHG